MSLMQSVVTSFIFPLLFSNTQLFLFVCVYLSCISYTVILGIQCYTMLFSVNMSRSILYPKHVFLFYLEFIFPFKKLFYQWKADIPQKLVICPTDCSSMASQMMVMVLPREHSKKSRCHSALVSKLREGPEFLLVNYLRIQPHISVTGKPEVWLRIR